ICDDANYTTQDFVKIAKKCIQDNVSEEWLVIDRNDICFSKSPTRSISEEILKRSEFVIGIIGNFYGEKYPEEDISYLEYELKLIGELNLPTLILYLSEQCESESDIQKMITHEVSVHARMRILADLMQRQERVKAYLNATGEIFEVVEVNSLEEFEEYLNSWAREFNKKKRKSKSLVHRTIVEPSSVDGIFIKNYNHLEYDRRPVNYNIQELDNESINFFLEQPEAVTKLREVGFLRSSVFSKLAYLGIFHDENPSLGALICFAPRNLLSNQYDSCKLHMVVYAGSERGSSRILQQQSISDNLLNLYDAAMGFLEKNLNNTGRIGTEERDDLEIPRLALREAIANAIVHRDYENSDFSNQPTRIEIYTNRVEITSFGPLPRGVLPSDLNDNPEKVIPFRRNPVIAEIFRIMQRVELNASGISRIHLASKMAKLSSPIISEINEASVKITLFRPSTQVIQTVSGNSNQVIGEVVENVFGGQNFQTNDPSLPVIQGVEGANITINYSQSPLSLDTSDLRPPSSLSCDYGLENLISREFVGRRSELQMLQSKLRDAEQVVFVAVAGMGGIGKTALAQQYVRESRDLYPGGRWYFNIRDTSLTNQLLAAAKIFGWSVPENTSIDSQVQWCYDQWVSVFPGRKLLVLDNVTTYNDIRPFLPRTQEDFRVLMTSRQRFGKPVDRLDLGVLPLDEALSLLIQVIDDGERVEEQQEEAEALCNWVGGLPLGVELVARYLSMHPNVSFVKLLDRLEHKQLTAKALRDLPEEMAYEYSIEAAFELSWQDLESDAKILMGLLSIFALAPIPSELIVWALPEWDEEDLEDKLDAVLVQRNFLQSDADGSYQLHQLIREFVVGKLETELSEETSALKKCVALAVNRFASNIEPIVRMRDRYYVSLVVPHMAVVAQELNDVLTDDDAPGWVFTGLARFYETQSLWPEAERWYKAQLEMSEHRFGSDHPDTARSLNNLAQLYKDMGRYDEAEPIYQRALAIYEAQLGSDHPDTARSLNNLAQLYKDMGRYDEAEPIYQRALAIYEAQLGS
ncbi:tetratricopeptide repeat protein, partial [Leptolyngbya cf. ectocarpi LEGE 11479]